MEELSSYEQQALAQIAGFKNPQPTTLGSWWKRVSAPLDHVAATALDSSAGAVVVRAMQDVVTVLNDGASWTVRSDTILEVHRAHGHEQVDTLATVQALTLEQVDEVARPLRLKYQALALAEGAGSGLLGGLALAADVALLVGLALRAVNEHATIYGFDMRAPGERTFAMTILSAATSPTEEDRRSALHDLGRLAIELTRQEVWQQTPATSSLQLTKKLAEVLAVRLIKAKLGQIIPLAGIAIAGGYNAWLLGAVTDTAFQLYRERFLAAKHGESVVERLDD